MLETSLHPSFCMPRAELERQQRARLAHLLQRVLPANPFYQSKFAGLDFDPHIHPLTNLPFTTRAELQENQRLHPPYGTNLTFSLEQYTRMHQTSGTLGAPLRWLDTTESWSWFKDGWQRVLDGARVSGRDVLLFPFSFGPFIGFWAAFEAAAERGCRVLPAGGLTSSARLQYLREHSATVVCCTPTYALHLAEVAAREGIDHFALSVRGLIVAGEPGGSVPATRQAIERAWDARVYDHAGMTETGPWGLELHDAAGGLHVLETEFIAEVIDPSSGEPAADGVAGELVLTNLGRIGSPLIRYRTGDQVTLTRSPLPQVSLRWAAGGIVGRIDDMLIIRGNNVFPSAIENILRESPAVAEFRLRPLQRESMAELLIEVELAEGASGDVVGPILERTLRDRLHFRPEIKILPPGSLPRFEMKARRVKDGG